jgi:hypothetical protein
VTSIPASETSVRSHCSNLHDSNRSETTILNEYLLLGLFVDIVNKCISYASHDDNYTSDIEEMYQCTLIFF